MTAKQRDSLVRDSADDRHGNRDHESQAGRVQVRRCPRDVTNTDCIGRQEAVIILHLRDDIFFVSKFLHETLVVASQLSWKFFAVGVRKVRKDSSLEEKNNNCWVNYYKTKAVKLRHCELDFEKRRF